VAVTCLRYEADGWGVAELCTDGGRVVWHELPRPESSHPHPGWGANPPPSPATVSGGNAREGDDFAPSLVARLRGYFAGDEVDFSDVELDLGDLTPFGHELARTLREVPRGEVVTYGELAALAGRPGAARAAGTFCAQNRHAVFVPCHRVVAADGLGGYGSLGGSYKRRLLALERVTL
jgi:methylated-DNA-[protein]-cysteine S-methyltransferase